eukprot:TRINITY_DN67466_c0_g1_i1.p1 TRINITY_DN67466_c0_g1~~TRINITY_DN67466_c0_g1_i1.p1  ORF type:complete len:333 (-),score=33.22 TRINITY_DN67466_c0_g1_i1:71-1069(-)
MRCAKQNLGGFVVENLGEGSEVIRVALKRQPPAALVGLRRTSENHTLHVRPWDAPKKTKSSSRDLQCWDAWVAGVSVLVAATEDPDGAAAAVRDVTAHHAVVNHLCGESAFTERWLEAARGGREACTKLVSLGQNLVRASGEAGMEVVSYFVEAGVHISCWDRLRARLTEGTTPLNSAELKAKTVTFTSGVAELAGLVCRMVEQANACGNVACADKIVSDTMYLDKGVFDMLLEIAADSGAADPLLLRAALQVVYIHLESDVVRPKVLQAVVTKLRQGTLLLPYMRGPMIDGVNNGKYQELWAQCEVKYELHSSARQRMPELFEKANNYWRQ